MSRILVTIEAGGRCLDAALPPHLTAPDLLAWIERAMGPFHGDTPRSLLMPDGSAINDGVCVAFAGVVDGMTLRAVAPATLPQPREATPRPGGNPDLPLALSMPERLLVTARALRGQIHPPGVSGPWARAVRAWQWTDHDRRLRWLIARSPSARGQLISASGHRSAEIGEQLALAFASTRREPVVLVDGDPAGRLSRHLVESGASWAELARDLADPTLGRLERDRLFARSPAGLPLLAAAEGITEHFETVLTTLCGHGIIVIVDEGPAPQRSPVGDPSVISTIGDVTPAPGAIVAAWGSEAPAIPEDGTPHVLMDGKPSRMLELAATVAGRWAMPEPAGQITGSSGEARRLNSSGPSGWMTRFSS